MSNTTAPEWEAGPPRTPDAPSTGLKGKGLHGNPWLTLLAVALGVMMVSLDGMHLSFAIGAIALMCAISVALLVRAGERREGMASVHV